ncbi:odorant receptor 4-like isoform X2 [Camponotus floridanus]|uniref:odorant receptor 4-like isoform X2 n=1 Tax=Camponotus floridanus TaxID=104421 RepID=UPI000DC6B5FE|nr:odorant receptor 4-like isoform X2 [Camponotus floridanus]
MTINKDLNYAFTTSRQCMKLLGIWPDPNVPLNVFRRPKIEFMLATCIMSVYVFTPQIINTIRAWGNISRVVELFVTANFSMMSIGKMIITRYHGEKLRLLISSMMTDWMTSTSNWERNIMLKLAKTGRRLNFGYFIAAIGTITFAFYVRLENVLQTMHQPRRYLPYRFDYIQKSPNYEITTFIQICGGAYAVLGNYSVDSFISILLLHICAQLINLQITLNNLIDKLDNKSISSLTFRKGLTAIIIRHEHLIRDAKMINDCYSSILFVHMLCASLHLCLVTFQIFTMITDNFNISIIKVIFLTIYIFLVLTQLYVYCYAAETLSTESINMAFGVYNCKWYNIPAKDAKDLMFIVYRSVISLKLTAGIFGNFSVELFGIAVKTSMGYLSALLTIRE